MEDNLQKSGADVEKSAVPSETERRRFLELAGKIAVGTPPAVSLLLSTPRAVAMSGHVGNGGGHIDAGRGNGSFPPGGDLDPGNSGGHNKGGD